MMISLVAFLSAVSVVFAVVTCPGVGQACYCSDNCGGSTSIGSKPGIMTSNGFCNTYDGTFCEGTGVLCSDFLNGCTCCPYKQSVFPTVEVCFDGVDNNGDGLADCADPQCDAQLCQAPGATLAGFVSFLPIGETDTANLPSINACNRQVCSNRQCVAESNLLEGVSCCNSAAFVGSTLEGLCKGTSTGLGILTDDIAAIHGGDSLVSTNNEKCHFGACTGCILPQIFTGANLKSDAASINFLCGPGFNTVLVVSAEIPLPIDEAYRAICLNVNGPDARGRVTITNATLGEINPFPAFAVNDFDVRATNITLEYISQFNGLTYTVQTAANANGARRVELLCDPSVQVCTAQQIIISSSPSCYAELITNGDGNSLFGGDKRAVEASVLPPLPPVSPAATVIVGGSLLSTSGVFSSVIAA